MFYDEQRVMMCCSTSGSLCLCCKCNGRTNPGPLECGWFSTLQAWCSLDAVMCALETEYYVCKGNMHRFIDVQSMAKGTGFWGQFEVGATDKWTD